MVNQFVICESRIKLAAFLICTVCFKSEWLIFSPINPIIPTYVKTVQCNLDLVTLNLVTTCDLVTIFQRPFFNLQHKNNIFSDIIRFSYSFFGDQKCHYIKSALYFVMNAQLEIWNSNGLYYWLTKWITRSIINVQCSNDLQYEVLR